jgi:hypothetical protein
LQERGKRRRVERTASDSMDRTTASRLAKRVHEGLPSEQNPRLRAGIEKETEGVAPVFARHSAPQFPLPPYTEPNEATTAGDFKGALSVVSAMLTASSTAF